MPSYSLGPQSLCLLRLNRKAPIQAIRSAKRGIRSTGTYGRGEQIIFYLQNKKEIESKVKLGLQTCDGVVSIVFSLLTLGVSSPEKRERQRER